jgi:hypothetical protein
VAVEIILGIISVVEIVVEITEAVEIEVVVVLF